MALDKHPILGDATMKTAFSTKQVAREIGKAVGWECSYEDGDDDAEGKVYVTDHIVVGVKSYRLAVYHWTDPKDASTRRWLWPSSYSVRRAIDDVKWLLANPEFTVVPLTSPAQILAFRQVRHGNG